MIRNPILFWYGLLCFMAGVICILLTQTTSVEVNNINAFIKPMKFFFSVWIFCWTMAWLLYELQQPTTTNRYSLMVVIVMTIELVIITWQAANGRLSHFNVSKPLYASFFTIMGIAISILTIWTLVIGFYFFDDSVKHLPTGYLWGIRLGILLFVVFSFEGGIMGAKLQHTIGAADGSAGIPLLNWSKQYGDLRVAHFFGIHALQLLPLAGYYLFSESKTGIFVFTIVYACAVTYTLVQALKGIPLFK
jgi:hypothetical protein